jgi:peptide/nickel transport system substrate-binding protein
MRRPTFLVALAALIGVCLASAAAARQTTRADESVVKIVTPGPLDGDPVYGATRTTNWMIEYAVALKLLNYPDKSSVKVEPEAATSLPAISNKGKTYTFTIRTGLRFSDGSRVTARNFAWAFDRILTKANNSPAAHLLANVQGAQAKLDGRAQHVSGVVVRGNKLTIRLTAPDGAFLAKLAMPFFQATSLNVKPEAEGIKTYPSAGPYYIASRTVNRRIVLKKNKYYKGTRPRNIDTFDISVNTNLDESVALVESGQANYLAADLAPSWQERLAAKYGVNKGQYHVSPLLETDYVALNTSRPLFGNMKLRQAVNYAIDRPALLRARGATAGRVTDQILPPGMSGFSDAKLYPLKGADYKTAKKLAGTSCEGKTANVYVSTTETGQALGQTFKFDLAQIGCDVTIRSFPPDQIGSIVARRGEPYDAIFVRSWTDDYPDPYDFLNILLDGNNIHADNNSNLAYFNNARVNRLLRQANTLTGPARYKTYGNLDILLSRNHAPWAAFANGNASELTSPGLTGYTFNTAYGAVDLTRFQLQLTTPPPAPTPFTLGPIAVSAHGSFTNPQSSCATASPFSDEFTILAPGNGSILFTRAGGTFAAGTVAPDGAFVTSFNGTNSGGPYTHDLRGQFSDKTAKGILELTRGSCTVSWDALFTVP